MRGCQRTDDGSRGGSIEGAGKSVGMTYVAHVRLNTPDVKLVLQGNRQAVQRPYRLLVRLKMGVQTSRIFERGIEENLMQAVELKGAFSSANHPPSLDANGEEGKDFNMPVGARSQRGAKTPASLPQRSRIPLSCVAGCPRRRSQ